MKKLTALIIAATMTVAVVNTSYANEDDNQGVTEPVGGYHDMMFQKLHLSDQQKTQVREIVKSQREKMPVATVDERREIHALIASDHFDKAKAEALISSTNAQHNAITLSRLETSNMIYNILTPEQKKQFDINFQKRMELKAEHHHQ